MFKPPPTTQATYYTPPSTTTTPTTTPPPAGQVLYSDSGSGIFTTPTFTTPDNWDVNWSFTAAGSGSQNCNFDWLTYTASGGETSYNGPNQLSPGGSGTEYYHAGAGTYYMEINAGCSWSVQVVTG
ncbi:MAG: hypothetical protein ACYDD4_03570 [Acidimicrobiales bacterium]